MGVVQDNTYRKPLTTAPACLKSLLMMKAAKRCTPFVLWAETPRPQHTYTRFLGILEDCEHLRNVAFCAFAARILALDAL